MPLKRYKVGDTILKLNDEDARRRGLLGQTSEAEQEPAQNEEPKVVSSSRAAPRTTKKA